MKQRDQTRIIGRPRPHLLTAIGVAAVVLETATSRRPLPATVPPKTAAAQRLSGASALLTAAALADSAIEHYRGSFHNKIMVLPIAVAAQALAASLHGTTDHLHRNSSSRDVSHALSLITGVAGVGFHLYNILKRTGGFGWVNLFYAAPLGAPVALSLAGILGGLAERVRIGRAAICGVPTGRLVTRLVALGLLGTAGEAGLMHFRGAYHNPAMLVPVTVPPVAAALLTGATITLRLGAPARRSLRLLVAVGFIGSALPRLWRPAQHGRLAQLVAKPAQWSAAPGTARFYGTGDRRARRALAWSSSGDERALPRLRCPRQAAHAVLEREDAPGHRRTSRIAARTALSRTRRMAGSGSDLRSHRAAASYPPAGAARSDGRRQVVREPRRRLSRPSRAAVARGLESRTARDRRRGPAPALASVLPLSMPPKRMLCCGRFNRA